MSQTENNSPILVNNVINFDYLPSQKQEHAETLNISDNGHDIELTVIRSTLSKEDIILEQNDIIF